MSAQTAPGHEWIWTEVRDPLTGHYRSGHGVLLHGADVSQETTEAAVRHEYGDGWERLVIEVQHLVHHRRIKRCSNLDGLGCDLDGEWHSHWSGVRHNDAAPDCCYTIALPVWPTRTPDCDRQIDPREPRGMYR